MQRIIVFAGLIAWFSVNALAAQNSAADGSSTGNPNGRSPADASGKAVFRTRNSSAAATSSSSNPIQYHGGPVLLGTPTVYYIWYGTWNDNSPTILQNLAQTIGTSPYFSVNTTYSSYSGSVTGKLAWGGYTVDNYSQGTSLSDAAVQAIVSSAITSHRLPADPNGIYFVLTAADVNETSGFCTQYCGWHTYSIISGTNVKYAFVGNPGRCPSACGVQSTTPNSNFGADSMASIIAHELEESVTDPTLNAWYDSSGNENADKCAWTFGTLYSTSNGSYANMNLGGMNYLIQQNWVNAGGGYCALKYSSAPIDTTPPTVSITTPATNATVSGTLTISANATDNVAVGDVQFLLDGVNLGQDLTAAPYSLSWNTAASSNGAHTLTATARDTSGNTATSAPVTVMVSNTITSPPSTGLIGYWNFDENSGTVAHDTSGSGYNGNISAATWTAGKDNSALRFNGSSSYVVTPNISVGQAFSVSVWVSPASNQIAYARIAETRYNGGFYLGADRSGTKYQFIVNTGAGSTGSCGVSYGCAVGGSVATGWHLVTGTFDGTSARLYVDGTLAGSDTFTAPANTAFPLYIGSYYGGGYVWYGVLDEVRLYNRALAASEVNALYTTP